MFCIGDYYDDGRDDLGGEELRPAGIRPAAQLHAGSAVSPTTRPHCPAPPSRLPGQTFVARPTRRLPPRPPPPT